MKYLFGVFLFLFLLNGAYSQAVLDCPNPFGPEKTYSRMLIGAGGGFTMLNGDKDKSSAFGMGTYINFDYKITNGFYAGVRFQNGSFAMSKTMGNDLSMNSKYISFGGGLLLYPIIAFSGKAKSSHTRSIGSSLVESFYVGVDVMHLNNTIKDIYRGNFGTLDNNAYGPIGSYDMNGVPVFKDKVSALILPSFNIGIAPKINNYKKTKDDLYTLRFVLNAQLNFANNDDLDGYNPVDQNFERVGLDNDSYYFFSLGFRYSF